MDSPPSRQLFCILLYTLCKALSDLKTPPLFVMMHLGKFALEGVNHG